MTKYISLEIYKPHYGDCSNDGLSSKYYKCYIEHEEGWIDEKDVPKDAIVKIVAGAFGSYHLEPIMPVAKDSVGYMMGGCYVSSSDSRWSRLIEKIGINHCAMALHDRTETYKEYEMYSN